MSNPIYRQKKQWWDICCDVSEGTVIDQSLPLRSNLTEDSGEYKIAQIDHEFITEIVKKIKIMNLVVRSQLSVPDSSVNRPTKYRASADHVQMDSSERVKMLEKQ